MSTLLQVLTRVSCAVSLVAAQLLAATTVAHAQSALGPGMTAGSSTTLFATTLRQGSLGLTVGRLDGGLGITRADGFNLSLVGQYPVGEAWALEGRVGANFSRPDTSALGANAFSDGLAYGAGLNWQFMPRATATLGWDSQELNFPGSGRETVRAARLGLQLRY